MAKLKYLLFHTPRTGSNALCSMLNQTGIAGIADYINCGFPLGALGKIERGEFIKKLNEYEDKQTTPNGVFGCKLSWEALIQLVSYVGVDYVYSWLDTIDKHFYLYRVDTIAQAVSFYIAAKRKFFSTTALDNGAKIEPTPDYDYNEIAFRRMLIERDAISMRTFFDDYKINPVYISFESMTRSIASLQSTTELVLSELGLPTESAKNIVPQIKKQDNAKKRFYKDRFLIEWDEIKPK